MVDQRAEYHNRLVHPHREQLAKLAQYASRGGLSRALAADWRPQ